jgi:hypothetical protein
MWQPTALTPEGPARPQEASHASPGERGSNNNSGSSAWHHVHGTFVLLPAGTTYRGTAKHYSVGEVQSAYEAILAPPGENGNVRRVFGDLGDLGDLGYSQQAPTRRR